MKFSGVWSDDAMDDLMRIWMAAPDQNQLARVVNQLEQQFALNPLDVGESREDDWQRIVVEPPVGILFDVTPPDRIVRVIHIGWLPPPLRHHRG